MPEKMFSIGEDFWIESQAGERPFNVDGKALRLRETPILRHAPGNEFFKVQRALGVRDKMEIERDGDHVADVSRRWFRGRDAYGVEIASGQDDALILAVVVCIDQMSHD
jgi:uncharacterized protein YxjI